MENETKTTENLEQRLAILEKTEKGLADNLKWGVDVLKWGLGIFAAVAISFAGFNSWTANRNYERDKEAFEKRLALLTQQFTTDNDKQITELRKNTEASFNSLSNSLQSQFLSLLANNSANVSNSFVLLNSNLIALAVTPMLVLSTNNEVRYETLVADLYNTLSNKSEEFYTNMSSMNDLIGTNVERTIARANGCVLMLQGNMFPGKPTIKKDVELAIAAKSLIDAVKLFFTARDELNMRHCITVLCDQCLPLLYRHMSKARLLMLDSRFHLSSKLKSTIALLSAEDGALIYPEEISKLQSQVEFLQYSIAK